MRYLACALALVAVFNSRPTFAEKGPCTEDSVRAGLNSGRPQVRTDDFYLFDPLLEQPVIGSEEHKKVQQAITTQTANRKNVKTEVKLDRFL